MRRNFYGAAGFQPADSAQGAAFNSGSFTSPVTGVTILNTYGYSGVYKGSLSSQGNMVAMQLNTGGLNYVPTGNYIQQYDSEGNYLGSIPETVASIYLNGYFRVYRKDPRTCTFGANTAMPALTGVMPSKYTTTPGNFLYYIDIQCCRVSGTNAFDNAKFISAFNSALSWVITSNGYLSALNSASNTGLSYYGADSYGNLISQGFDTLATGSAVKTALGNQGIMVSTIPQGNFGTPNAVAQVMLEQGLGSINNMSTTLLQNGVTLNNIESNNYTAIISSTLANITNPTDLSTIQYVVESSIPDMQSALDYTIIERSSGLPNDSQYVTMAEVGEELYRKAPNSTFTTGKQLKEILENVQSAVSANVEAIGNTSVLLNPDIVSSIRSYLPVSANNQPITVLNIIGSASGYLTEYIQKVNDGLAALAATDYGSQLSSLFGEISRYAARVPLDTAEQLAAVTYQPIPPGVYEYQTNETGTIEARVVSPPGPDYWQVKTEEKKQQYYALVNTIMADTTGTIPAIIKQINDNYDLVCQQINLEYNNWMKANIQISGYNDANTYLGFVSSLPGYGADTQNLGSDYLLYNMAMPNTSGDLVKSILAQAKNNSLFSNVGVRIKGIL